MRNLYIQAIFSSIVISLSNLSASANLDCDKVGQTCEIASLVTGDDLLINAAKNGLLVEATRLLELEANINVIDNEGFTPLMLAAKFKHFEIAKLLLEKGACLNIISKNGSTALIQAACSGCQKITELLLNAGADINIANDDDFTALTCATHFGYFKIAELLLLKIAATESEHAALIHAVRSGRQDLVELLFVENSNISFDHNDIALGAALSLAAHLGHKEIAKFLLHAEAKANPVGGKLTALTLAVWSKNLERVKFLLELGVDVNATGPDGSTALISAADGDLKIVELLLQKKVDINAVDLSGGTALMHAVASKKQEIIALLLHRGADLTIENKRCLTALMIAAESGNVKALELLLDRGASINAVNSQGQTSLMSAAGSSNGAEVVEFLLQKRASIDIVDKKNNSCVDYAYDELNNRRSYGHLQPEKINRADVKRAYEKIQFEHDSALLNSLREVSRKNSLQCISSVLLKK